MRCAFAALLVIVAGCARPPAPASTLRMAVAAPPEALDPRFATSATAMRLAALVASPLVVIGEDLRPQPFLAESVEQPTPRTWVVRLREGLRFHDGTAVTSDDVVFTFESMKDPATGSPHRGKLAHLERVVAVDERTVRFELDQPWAPFLVDQNGYGIVSRACSDPARNCRHAPIGAGPYRVESALDDDERIRLVAHDGSAVPEPAIERIDVKVARDPTTRLLELLDGRVDFVGGDLSPTDLDVITSDTGRDAGLVVESAAGLGWTYLAFNVRGDASSPDATLRALADPRVRRALAIAVDVDAIIAKKLRGRARRAHGMLPDGHWAAPVDDAGQPLPALPYDVDEARRLLREAGAEGLELTLATTPDRQRKAIAVLFAEAWRAIGVDVDIQVKDWAALYEDIQGGAFHVFSAKWVPVVEPDLMHWVFSSTNIPVPSATLADGTRRASKAGGNRGGYVDVEVDALLAQAQSEVDVDKRAALYREAWSRIAAALPVVPLWFEDEVAVRSARVEGYIAPRTGSYLPLARARLRSTAPERAENTQ